MKTIVIAVAVLLTSLFKCEGSKKTGEYVPVGCSESASVVDFTGLDGCGIMLVLEDGTRLIPEKRTYIQAPKKEDDPLYFFELTAGDSVKIGYRSTDNPNSCMAGKSVFITCITKIN